jgi:hypothetical protein
VLNTTQCVCNVPVKLDQGFDTHAVELYYALTNYYQNHRRYVKSRWDPQLRAVTAKGGVDCDPLNTVEVGGATKYYAPCGFVANSLFNDTIELYRCPDAAQCTSTSVGTKIPLSGQHIAWPSDRDVKFRNPDYPAGGSLCDAPALNISAPPPNWPVPLCKLGVDTPGPAINPWSPAYGSNGVGYENEDLMVWMRTAALPNFRKLYRKVGTDLPNGRYFFRIGFRACAQRGGSRRPRRMSQWGFLCFSSF